MNNKEKIKGAFVVFAGTEDFVKEIKVQAKETGLETSKDYMQIIKRNSKMGRELTKYFIKSVTKK